MSVTFIFLSRSLSFSFVRFFRVTQNKKGEIQCSESHIPSYIQRPQPRRRAHGVKKKRGAESISVANARLIRSYLRLLINVSLTRRQNDYGYFCLP